VNVDDRRQIAVNYEGCNGYWIAGNMMHTATRVGRVGN
jgi:hypothetical protein